MAVLGIQVVFSMVMFTFLHKLAPYFSIGRWLLSKRLYRYLHPTNDELNQPMASEQSQVVNSKLGPKDVLEAQQLHLGMMANEKRLQCLEI